MVKPMEIDIDKSSSRREVVDYRFSSIAAVGSFCSRFFI